jgi:hypothetical protein
VAIVKFRVLQVSSHMRGGTLENNKDSQSQYPVLGLDLNTDLPNRQQECYTVSDDNYCLKFLYWVSWKVYNHFKLISWARPLSYFLDRKVTGLRCNIFKIVLKQTNKHKLTPSLLYFLLFLHFYNTIYFTFVLWKRKECETATGKHT